MANGQPTVAAVTGRTLISRGLRRLSALGAVAAVLALGRGQAMAKNLRQYGYVLDSPEPPGTGQPDHNGSSSPRDGPDQNSV